MGLSNPVHILLVALVVVLVFGVKRFPDLARGAGRGLRDVKRATGIEEMRADVGSVRDTVRAIPAQVTGQEKPGDAQAAPPATADAPPATRDAP